MHVCVWLFKATKINFLYSVNTQLWCGDCHPPYNGYTVWYDAWVRIVEAILAWTNCLRCTARVCLTAERHLMLAEDFYILMGIVNIGFCNGDVFALGWRQISSNFEDKLHCFQSRDRGDLSCHLLYSSYSHCVSNCRCCTTWRSGWN